MNILQMRHAVGVARRGSIAKAAEALLTAPSTLSRSLEKLEAGLGTVLFLRSHRGAVLTPAGEEFIHRAEKILAQVDLLENRYRTSPAAARKFAVSVPRASYISEAFSRFSREIGPAPVELHYHETNPYRVVQDILTDGYKLGIIRYGAQHDRYFKAFLREKGLASELILEFRYALVMSEKSALAAKREIRLADLLPLIEVAHGDPFVPTLPAAAVKSEELPGGIKRRILVFERGSQLDLLSVNPAAFMWSSPVPGKLLRCYGLVQRECPEDARVCRDVLIYPEGYAFSEFDKQFIAQVFDVQNEFS